jgi:hypothetical protein
MIIIGFIYCIYLAFSSHIFYVVAEKGERFYKDDTFWLLTIGILLTTYLIPFLEI